MMSAASQAPSFAMHIPVVVRRGSQKQMGWISTSLVVADMADENTFGDGAAKSFIGKAMSQGIAAIPDMEMAIAANLTRNPLPAMGLLVNLESLEKLINQVRCDFHSFKFRKILML